MPAKTFTIDATDNFTHTLVKGVWERFGDNPLTLSDIRIFLPTRRACRAVANAFLQLSNGKAMVLPRLIPLGEADTDEETLIVHELASDKPDETVLNLRPAMPSMQRNLLLARHVMTAYPEMPMAQAVSLAKDLASFIDQSVTAGIDFEKLKNLVPEDYSEHWQKTLEFLDIVTHGWSKILEEYHVVDSATRRDELLRAQAKAWQKSPPSTPVIAAGINGSIPAALDLLRTIAELENGYIILPSLDTLMDDESWDKIGDTHPQKALKTIIDSIETDRSAVIQWLQPTPPDPRKTERLKLVSQLMLPAETSDKWQTLSATNTLSADTACKGINRIDCADESEEAAVIALILRETLETENKTALLITPDRKLARRVTHIMQRWGIIINDSAGAPLSQWGLGSFINLSLSFLANPADAVSFLALLKHNLCRCGHYSDQWHTKVARFETHALRGSRYKKDFSSYYKTAEHRAKEAEGKKKSYPLEEITTFLDKIKDALSPLLAMLDTGKNYPLADWLSTHVQILENLATTADKPGNEWLWRNEDGEAAALALTELLDQSTAMIAIDFSGYAAMIQQLVLNRTVRPKTPAHPRVTILSALESRLLTADTVILSSLNEGHWPPESPNDPWMSRPMRAAYGLPSTDRFIGLAAHDFMNGFCADEVYLTRADRIDNAPSVKSRWLLRLETVLSRLDFEADSLLNRRYLSLAEQLETIGESEKITIGEPCPCPPVSLRPTGLSFTDIEKWLKNPYGIYAKHILKLRKLDELDGNTEHADKGTLFHAILERFVSDLIDGKPLDLHHLTAIAKEEFDAILMDETTKATLWPIFEEVAVWFVEEQKKRQDDDSGKIIPLAAEQRAQWTIKEACVPFTLYGRVDRIDGYTDGSLEIIDYKTGTLPSETDIVSGYAPQLPLEALVAQESGLGNVEKKPVKAISHWELKAKKDKAPEIKTIPKKANEAIGPIIDQAKQQLLAMIEAFYNTENPASYRVTPDSQNIKETDNVRRYDDYKHLARESEWKD